MGHACTLKKVAYLEFKFNWIPYILSGNVDYKHFLLIFINNYK